MSLLKEMQSKFKDLNLQTKIKNTLPDVDIKNYQLVLGYNSKQYETGNFEPDTYFVFDLIKDRTVSKQLDVSTQPMQSGDIVADHFYRQPLTLNVDGMFSLNGKNVNSANDNYTKIYHSGDRLSDIESAFEKIQDEGYLCTLAFLAQGNDDKNKLNVNNPIRFKKRKNMLLKSATFTEQYNTMKFNFNFTEVILANQQEYYNLTEEERNYYYLPNVAYNSMTSLSKLIQDDSELTQMVVKVLYDGGYLSDEFVDKIKEKIYESGDSLVYGGLAIGIVGAIVSGIFLPVGLIILAGGVVTMLIGMFKSDNAYENAKDKIIIDLDENGEVTTGLGTIAEICNACATAFNNLDLKINIYQFGDSDLSDNGKEVVLKLGDDIYCISVNKNNVNGELEWELFNAKGQSLKVTNTDGEEIDTPIICHSINDLKDTTKMWFSPDGVYKVFLFSSDENKDNDLDYITIWVASGDIEESIKTLTDTIAGVIADRLGA